MAFNETTGTVISAFYWASSGKHQANHFDGRFIKIILTDLNDVKVEKPKKDINELCISRSDNEHGQKEYKKNAI